MRPTGWAATAVLVGVLAGCSTNAPPEPASTPSRSLSATEGPTAIASTGVPSRSVPAVLDPTVLEPTVVEPTTTNTLPPPPEPTRPAPIRSGPLTARSLPVPAGWRTVVLRGGAEEGYQGNGTWVHGRDPRYAAHDTVGVGCAPVTRDDYRDPTAALEGTYTRSGRPGVGLVLEFADDRSADRFFGLYADQLAACTDPDGLLITRVATSPLGLLVRRSYPDGEWTEVVRGVGRRVTLIALADPGHRISVRDATSVLVDIGRSSRR